MSKGSTVMYILGKGHSGSTLVNLVLGNSKYCFSLGEIKYLEQTNYDKERFVCDCGQPLKTCDFWSNIKKPRKFFNRKVSFTKKCAILLEFLGLKTKKEHFESKEFYEHLLQKAKGHKGEEVNTLIDSSKDFTRAMYLSNIGVDIKFLHVIKDIRNFAYSDYKRGRFSWYLIWSWFLVNTLIPILSKLTSKQYYRISYEKFTKNWEEYLPYLNSFTNLQLDKDNLISDMNKEQYHNFAGNPMRTKELKEIYHDDKWKENLPVYLKFILTVLFFIPNYLLVYRDSSNL